MASYYTLPVNKDDHEYLFSICSIVTNMEEYELMKQSFEACGFDADCEYIVADNTKENVFDAYQSINRFLKKAKGKYIIIAHQDLRCIDNSVHLQQVLTRLDEKDPQWAVCGNAGSSGYHRGVRYIVNGGRMITYDNLPARVSSLDENLLIVKASADIVVSGDIRGFHLYGTDLCLVADFLGYNSYVIPFMVKHLSLGNLKDLEVYQQRFVESYGRKLRSRFVETTCTKFMLGSSAFRNRVLNMPLIFFFVKAGQRIRSMIGKKDRHRKSVRPE